MAIQQDIPASPLGVGFSKAYIRIWRATYVKDQESYVQLHVCAYVLKPHIENQQPIDQQILRAPWAEVLAQPGDDFIAQCYAWLHNQPEFAGGEAV
jgi:hypothetical protein